jgi:hypothetical protein
VDGRITSAPTPAGRLAAFFRSFVIQNFTPIPALPDYADIAESIEPFLDKELILARIGEAERAHRNDRIEHLKSELGQVTLVLEGIKMDVQTDGPAPVKRLLAFAKRFVFAPIPQSAAVDEAVLEPLLMPFLEKELALACLHEAGMGMAQDTDRKRHLAAGLVKIEARIADILKYSL